MDTSKQLTTKILEKLSSYKPQIKEQLTGRITEAADGVAKISGLYGVAYLEMVEFPGGIMGVAINLEEDAIGAIVLGEYETLKEGDEVRATGRLLSVPVGESLIGRVVNSLGEEVDGKGEIRVTKRYPLEKIAPGVTARQPVNVSLATGIKAIDAIVPIGRGQRQLIIGDRGTGKTQITLDTIINQKGKDVICIYVAIGQKRSRIAQVVEALNKKGALAHTIVVAASASDPASFQYIAPYAGCAIGEYFMDKGKDVLLIYDDLSKHAWAYRQISLILKRPSGREAYPGDVFYLHSRLLERACRLNKDNGGGSITALPIIETLAGDLSAYIPTNVISITDGQIFLEPDLFNAGFRPAISVGLSVSRVGGSAQVKAMKQVAGKLRLDLAQYRSLAAFAQFASDLDSTTRSQIDRGSRMTELLKQAQFSPLSIEDQVLTIWVGTKGYIDDVPKDQALNFATEFVEFVKTSYRKTVKAIGDEKTISEKTEKELVKAISEFKDSWKKAESH